MQKIKGFFVEIELLENDSVFVEIEKPENWIVKDE